MMPILRPVQTPASTMARVLGGRRFTTPTTTVIAVIKLQDLLTLGAGAPNNSIQYKGAKQRAKMPAPGARSVNDRAITLGENLR
mmetsp:Transcript_124654/g.233076  ORF Transcript_124654/g.233076 Transcript_124654/m.233076 type:complete len:84 (+) Transcript_124654:296-547(+)